MERDFEFVRFCPVCKKRQSVMVNIKDYIRWERGELTQRCFPYLSAEEREIIISGVCPDCWENMFGKEEAV